MGTSPVAKGLVRNNARKKLLFILIAIGDPSMVLSWAKSQSKISHYFHICYPAQVLMMH